MKVKKSQHYLEVLLLGALDQVSADLLETFYGLGGQGNPDPVNGTLLGRGLGILVHRHVLFGCCWG